MTVERGRAWSIFMVLSCLLFGHVAQSARSEEPELVKYVVAGWEANRARLTSYSVSISGVSKPCRGDASSIAKETRKIRIESVVDAVQPLARHEVTWGEYEGNWIQLADGVAQWRRHGDDQVVIVRNDAKRLDFVRLIDPRTLGMLPFGPVVNGMDFHKVKKFLHDGIQFATAKELADGRVELTWTCEDNPQSEFYAKMVSIINPQKGFSAEEYTLSLRTRQLDFWIPQTKCSTTNEEKEGIWVPISFQMQDPLGNEIIECDIRWNQINQPVNQSVFSPENIGAPQGTLVSDARIDGQYPVVLQRIGDPSFRPSPVNQLRRDVSLASRGNRMTRLVATGVSAFLFLVALVVFVRRRVSKRRMQ